MPELFGDVLRHIWNFLRIFLAPIVSVVIAAAAAAAAAAGQGHSSIEKHLKWGHFGLFWLNFDLHKIMPELFGSILRHLKN